MSSRRGVGGAQAERRGRHDARRVSRAWPPADRLDRRLPGHDRRSARHGPDRARRGHGAASRRRRRSSPRASTQVFRDLDRIILPGLSHWQHPSFFGYFPSNASLASVLGDYLSTGLGVLGLSWQSSPAPDRARGGGHRLGCGRWSGLSDAWSGVIQDTASTSTLVALLCARERATGFGMSRGGLAGRGRGPWSSTRRARPIARWRRRPCSPASAARTCGLVAHDDAYAMRPDALDEAIRGTSPRASGPAPSSPRPAPPRPPPSIPLEAIADVARAHGLWLHVDAAMAGSAMILPECRWMWEGIEGADSLVLNAHKWLGAAFDCSLYYVRDPEHLVRVMSTNPELPADRRPTSGSRTTATGASRWAAGSAR